MQFPQFGSDIVRLTASNVFNNAVTFLTGFIIAATVTADVFGIYSVALYVVMVIFSVSDFGMNISIVRYYNKSLDTRVKNRVLQAGLWVKIFVSTFLILISFPLGWLLSEILSPDYSIQKELSIAVLCASTLGFWMFIRSVYQARQDYRPYAGLTFRYGLIRLLLVGIVFSFDVPSAIFYLVALYLLGPLLAACTAIFVFIRDVGVRFDVDVRKKTRQLLSYGKWVMVGSVLYPLCFSLPLFILMRMAGADAAGQYSVGLMFVAIISPFNDAIRAFLLPKVSGFECHIEARNYVTKLRRFALPYSCALLTLVGGCAIMYKLFLGQEYPDGLLILVLLMIASGITVFGGIINNVMHYLGIPHIDACVNVGRIFFIAVTSVIAIPYFGALGAAMSAGAAMVIGEIITFSVISRYLKSAQ
ncbi:hypothetical protein A9Q89_04775 [Gammaproteobacteria bacterium 53_120_T64]|nr:hypothetical protein A9Q89_04775 [Gammaproteobacteria bacterium 53_120_T64]